MGIAVRGKVMGVEVPDIHAVDFEIKKYDFAHGDYVPKWQAVELTL